MREKTRFDKVFDLAIYRHAQVYEWKFFFIVLFLQLSRKRDRIRDGIEQYE